MLTLGLGCVIAMALLAADSEAAASEIDGEWRIISTSWDGKSETEEEPSAKVRFENGKLTVVEDHMSGEGAQHDDEIVLTRFRVKPKTSPKQIDLLSESANDKKNRTIQGIYQLIDDELVLCFSRSDDLVGGCAVFDIPSSKILAEGPRPSTFDDRNQIVLTLKRMARAPEKSS